MNMPLPWTRRGAAATRSPPRPPRWYLPALMLLLLPLLLLLLGVATPVRAGKPAMRYANADALEFATRTDVEEDALPDVTARDDVWVPMEKLVHQQTVESLVFDRLSEALFTKEAAGSLHLYASPSALIDGEDLVITWSGFSGSTPPHANDFIGLSCGPRAHARDYLATVKVQHHTSVRFSSLFMMRCSYRVAYVHYDDAHGGKYMELATLTVPMKESWAAPKHGHVALTTEADAMAVMFNSASNATPVVQFGTSPDALHHQASGNWTTYTASDMCQAPATTTSQGWFRDPGYMHTVVLRALARGTRYFYRFGNDADGWSAVHSFKSRPSAQDTRTVKFLAYADMGVDPAPAATSTAVRAYQEVVGNGYDDFLLHFGDISYARGHGHMWDEFFHLIEPYATQVPYMISVGNHEYDYTAGGKGHDPSGAVASNGGMDFHPFWGNFGSDSEGECSVPMFHRWHAPSNGRGIYWYSFNYGSVHVVQISSEHDWRRGSTQYQWLERDLQQVDRRETPWIVLTSHRMMYTTQMGELADLLVSYRLRSEMEDLLWKYKVNVMLVGHQHSYERSCAVRDGKCTADGVGPVHLVIGSAGAGLEQRGFSRTIGEWSVSHVNDWGYLRMAASQTEMSMQFVLNRNGVVYDEVTLQPWL